MHVMQDAEDDRSQICLNHNYESLNFSTSQATINQITSDSDSCL